MSSQDPKLSATSAPIDRLSPVRAVLDRVLPYLPVLASIWLLRGAFSTERIFFVRDLTLYTWPLTRWLRTTFAGGHLPIWNPSIGFGQAVVADPSLQLLFPFTILPRLFLPDPVGLNVAVAMAYPVGAAGAYVWLRRRMTPGAASLGATLFVASGPFLAMGYMLNLSWSVALLPWVLWATDGAVERPDRRRIGVLALAFALLAVAGEPLVLAVTAILAVLSAATGVAAVGGCSWRACLRSTGVVVAAGLLGACVAAVQLLPALDQSSRSLRSDGTLPDDYRPQWFVIAEMVVPNYFGSTLSPADLWGHWFYAIHGWNEPVLLSLYCGAGAVILALVGVTSGRHTRWAIFLGAVAVLATVLSLGATTELYPALKRLPVFAESRIPLKFMAFVVVALSGLAAEGWDALRRPTTTFGRWRHLLALGGGLLFTAIAAGGLAWCRGWRDSAERAAAQLAASLYLPIPDAHGAALVEQTLHVAPRVLVVCAIATLCILLGASVRGYGSWLRAALFAAVVVDLLAANAFLNPTVPLSDLDAPAWIGLTNEHPADRIFITGHSELAYESGLTRSSVFPRLSPVRDAAVWCAALPIYGMGNDRRDGLTIDLAVMSPRRYIELVGKSLDADMAARARMLRRSNVRYVIARVPPGDDARELIRIDTLEALSLYEWEPSPRVAVAGSWEVRADRNSELEALFDEATDTDTVAVLDADPPPPTGEPNDVDRLHPERPAAEDAREPGSERRAPSGEAGSTGAPAQVSAEIESESPTEIAIRCVAGPDGGFLKVRDIYDPNWKAEVDGAEAPVLVTEGVFRAVRIAPGQHLVRFVYWPRMLVAGLGISAVAFALMLAMIVAGARGRATPRSCDAPGPDPGDVAGEGDAAAEHDGGSPDGPAEPAAVDGAPGPGGAVDG